MSPWKGKFAICTHVIVGLLTLEDDCCMYGVQRCRRGDWGGGGGGVGGVTDTERDGCAFYQFWVIRLLIVVVEITNLLLN